MAGDLESLCMSVVDRRLQFFGRDMHVRLERGCALSSTIVDSAGGVIRVLQNMQLGTEGGRAFEVRAGEKEPGAGNFSCVDIALEGNIGVRFNASGSARG